MLWGSGFGCKTKSNKVAGDLKKCVWCYNVLYEDNFTMWDAGKTTLRKVDCVYSVKEDEKIEKFSTRYSINWRFRWRIVCRITKWMGWNKRCNIRDDMRRNVNNCSQFTIHTCLLKQFIIWNIFASSRAGIIGFHVHGLQNRRKHVNIPSLSSSVTPASSSSPSSFGKRLRLFLYCRTDPSTTSSWYHH